MMARTRQVWMVTVVLAACTLAAAGPAALGGQGAAPATSPDGRHEAAERRDAQGSTERIATILEEIDAQRETLIEARRAKIKEIQIERRKVKRAVIKPSLRTQSEDHGRWMTFRSRELRDRELASLERWIQANRDSIDRYRDPRWAPRLAAWDGEEAIGIGSWGRLEPTPHCRNEDLKGRLMSVERCDGPLRVFQVRGPDEVLVECIASDTVYSVRVSGGAVVKRPVDTENLTVQVLLVRGLPTDGMVDGELIEIEPIVEVTGTYTFNVPLQGPNTVYVVEALGIEAWMR